jgi:hypothetical protein
MKTISLFSAIIAIALTTTISTEAAASQSEYDQLQSEYEVTLSNWQLRKLLRHYLDDFQAVDPNVTRRDLKNIILGLNTSNIAEIEAALENILLSMQPQEVNQAPIISGTPVASVIEGEQYLFIPSASDPDGDNLSFSIANKPDWAEFDSHSGVLSGMLTNGTAGLYSGIVISVSDGELSDNLASFDVLVEAAPQVQQIGAPTLTSISVSGSDIVLAWTMQYDTPEGGYDTFIDGVDTAWRNRTSNTSVTLSGLDLSLSHCFKVESRYTELNQFPISNELCSEAQTPPNQAPVISGSPTGSITEGEQYLFVPSASDPDGDNLSFTIANKPTWASFDSSTGALGGTPASGTAGRYSGIVISVSDGELSDSLSSFDILVEEEPPTQQIGAPTLTSVTVSGTDIVLAWTMEFDIPDGGYDTFIDGVDTGWQYRTNNTSVTLSGLDLSVSHCFKVESRYTDINQFPASSELCSEAQTSNQLPEISGTPSPSVTAGLEYSFTPSASDADGDSLSFTVVNLPAWAGFDSQTGTLSGTPQATDAGTYSDIRIAVSDGTDSAQLDAFSIQVTEPEPDNQAPVISGTPASSVTEGEAYLFTPSASDPDGDDLSFTIASKPAWASFDSSTGVLSGTPASGTAGLYSGIVISVSDGELTAELSAFSILVEEPDGLATATIRWAAPSTREDGTALPLSEIDGYRIYMGDSKSSLIVVLDINDSSVTQYTLTDISKGDHYFAVSAYDIEDRESGLSDIILKSCQ